MPRAVAPPKRPVAPAIKAKQLAAVPAPLEAIECPLCIENLDDTDRDFFPCPCGYQVCLFCYQRLQKEYNNTCPGCRQQYGDDLDAVRKQVARKQAAAQAEAAAQARAAASAGHGGGSGHAGGHAAHHAHALHAHAARGGGGKAPPPPAGAKRHPHEPGHAGHGHGGRPGPAGHDAGSPGGGSGLPASSNWVAAHTAGNVAASEPHEPLPPAAGDEAAWPTLGVAAAKHEPIERRHSSSSLQHGQREGREQPHAPSLLAEPGRSSCDSSTSASTPEHQQHVASSSSSGDVASPSSSGVARRDSSGFTPVEVTTVVGGARHSVCVPVSNHSVAPFPEAATLLDMLRQAVNGSKLSSTEAAVQLVQCLRKLEADSGSAGQQGTWLQQALASGRGGGFANGGLANGGSLAGKLTANGRPPAAPGSAARAPPPGFGHAAGARPAAYAPQSQLQQQAELAAAARGTPYRPVAAGVGGGGGLMGARSEAYASQSSLHSIDSDSSLFSQGSSLSQSVLWQDGGLPGVDFGAGGLGAGMPSAVPARVQMLWANAGGQQQGAGAAAVPAPGGGRGFGSLAPPPGFPASNGLGGYNPLGLSGFDASGGGGTAGLAAPPGFGQPQGAQRAVYQL